jgi:hypothetical protein
MGLLLRRDPVRNLVVLRLRQDVPRYDVVRFAIGASRNHPIRLPGSHAGQAQQLLSRRRIQIERLVAVPSLSYAFGHSLGVALRFRRRFCGLLFDFLGVWLSLGAARKRSQQNQNWQNVSISQEGHIDHLFSEAFSPRLWMTPRSIWLADPHAHAHEDRKANGSSESAG